MTTTWNVPAFTCPSRKVPYASRVEARTFQRDGLGGKGSVYRCPYCKAWHLTTHIQFGRKQKAEKRKRLQERMS